MISAAEAGQFRLLPDKVETNTREIQRLYVDKLDKVALGPEMAKLGVLTQQQIDDMNFLTKTEFTPYATSITQNFDNIKTVSDKVSELEARPDKVLTDADILAMGFLKTDRVLTAEEISELGFLTKTEFKPYASSITQNFNNIKTISGKVSELEARPDQVLTAEEISALNFIKRQEVLDMGYMKKTEFTPYATSISQNFNNIKTISDKVSELEARPDQVLTDADIAAFGYIKSQGVEDRLLQYGVNMSPPDDYDLSKLTIKGTIVANSGRGSQFYSMGFSRGAGTGWRPACYSTTKDGILGLGGDGDGGGTVKLFSPLLLRDGTYLGTRLADLEANKVGTADFNSLNNIVMSVVEGIGTAEGISLKISDLDRAEIQGIIRSSIGYPHQEIYNFQQAYEGWSTRIKLPSSTMGKAVQDAIDARTAITYADGSKRSIQGAVGDLYAQVGTKIGLSTKLTDMVTVPARILYLFDNKTAPESIRDLGSSLRTSTTWKKPADIAKTLTVKEGLDYLENKIATVGITPSALLNFDMPFGAFATAKGWTYGGASTLGDVLLQRWSDGKAYHIGEIMTGIRNRIQDRCGEIDTGFNKKSYLAYTYSYPVLPYGTHERTIPATTGTLSRTRQYISEAKYHTGKGRLGVSSDLMGFATDTLLSSVGDMVEQLKNLKNDVKLA